MALKLNVYECNIVTFGGAESAEHSVRVVELVLVEVELLDAEGAQADIDSAVGVAGVCLGYHLREGGIERFRMFN